MKKNKLNNGVEGGSKVMDPKLKKSLDRLFNLIVNSAYGFPHPELPDNPKEAFERYSKLLERRK